MLLDSNILIGYLNDDEHIALFLEQARSEQRHLCISVISYTETLSLPSLSPSLESRVRAFLETFHVLSLDTSTGDAAARLRRSYRLTLADACIAATALLNDMPLVTRDKTLHKVKEITIATL